MAKFTMPLRCPILALSSAVDPHDEIAKIEEQSTYTQSDFKQISFEGDHFFIFYHEKEAIKTINEMIQENLREEIIA